ncbi:hypothetical protein HZ996_05670 [Cryomorphaceae bacterium]|nr:hypothetical protein HZ996_05670 [Cryomorphaceae bacterium]
MKLRCLWLGVIVLTQLSLSAQNDTLRSFEVSEPFYRPNVIKFNPTPSLVWDVRSAVISYERVVKPYQSFAITAGYLRMPGLIKERTADTALFNFDRSRSNGYSLLAEYRFYFKSENKGFAPHGLFFAPYMAHHNHWWESNANIEFESGGMAGVDINSHLYTLGIGAQIGYQFSFFNDKLAVDLITFAPSYALYGFTLGTEGNSDVPLDEYYPELVEWLFDEYPWLTTLTDGELATFSGSTNAFKVGARFVIQVGYRF